MIITSKIFDLWLCEIINCGCVVAQSDLHSTVSWVGGCGEIVLPSRKQPGAVSFYYCRRSHEQVSKLEAPGRVKARGKYDQCVRSLLAPGAQLFKRYAAWPGLQLHTSRFKSFFFSVLFFYEEPKGWDGNLWWCSVCALHMSITGVYLQKMSLFEAD